MIKKEVINEKRLLLKQQLCSTWDIKDYYWYHLAQTNRNDIIAFNYEYIDEPTKILFLIEVLNKYGITKIYEYTWGIDMCTEYDLNSFSNNAFWRSDSYFYDYFNEVFWFSDSMEWIIYFTHEETITIGGNSLIKHIKSQWSDWKENLWDNLI
jgi:hypothetical protein